MIIADRKLLVADILMQVPVTQLCYCCVDGGHCGVGARSDACFFVCIPCFTDLKNLSNENSLGVGRVRTYDLLLENLVNLDQTIQHCLPGLIHETYRRIEW